MRLQLCGFLLVMLVGAAPARAQWQLGDQSWCDDYDTDDARYCEVRRATIPGVGSLEVDGGPNGGIAVVAWDGSQVEIEARVTASAREQDRADELASEIQLVADEGLVEADGPRTGRRESWGVSYRIRVPRETDLDLRTVNGGIDIREVTGAIDFRTTNGGVALVALSGDVQGRTTNGGVEIQLTGDTWQGDGLDVETTNGGVRLIVPDGYSAELEVGTTNGGIDIDFPVTVQGRIGRRQLSTTLGDGGATVRAVTTNGGVRVARR